MYPLIPADARIGGDPPVYALDGQRFPLTPDEAARLAALAPRLTGTLRLEQVVPARDTELIRRMHERGLIYDLPVTADTVPTGLFCDYLYARVTCWRTNKNPPEWPWRALIDDGHASMAYLQGILIENYHYVHAASLRQSPLLNYAASPGVYDLVRDFVTGEAAHEGYFLDTLTRWGVDADSVR